MSWSTRRAQRREKQLAEAVDHVVSQFDPDAGELRGVAPHGVVGYAIRHETKHARSEEFVARLGTRGIAAVVYDGYSYKGDSADERDPFRLYMIPMDSFEKSGDTILKAPVPPQHVLELWAQTKRAQKSGAGQAYDG